MKAFITGITGQDGSYLAEHLLEKGYDVYGLVRRSSTEGNLSRIQHLLNDIHICGGDMTDSISLSKHIREIKPDEIYNLAAQTDVAVSFEQPEHTWNINAKGVLSILHAVLEYVPSSKVYQASTSELYGYSIDAPQDEKTPFAPNSPYSISKLSAYWFVVYFRKAYSIFASNGILYNHESPRRGMGFVTKKNMSSSS